MVNFPHWTQLLANKGIKFDCFRLVGRPLLMLRLAILGNVIKVASYIKVLIGLICLLN